MPALILVAGLPGSGKSRWIKSQEDGDLQTFDDFHADAVNNSSDPTAARDFERLLASLRKGCTCMVIDIAFCDPARRARLVDAVRRRVPEVEVSLRCFENDPEACRANLRSNCAARSAKIDEFSPVYDIPPEAEVLPVWRPSPDP